MRGTFGLEEEFVLLDPHSLSTLDVSDAAIGESGGTGDGVTVHEFFDSQVECVSPVFTSGATALEAVTASRARLAAWAERSGVVVAGSGTPFRIEPDAAVHGSERYAHIVDEIGMLRDDHQINGLHVHLGIDSRDDGIHISNALRPWLPVLLALSSNSPFWHGRDTGFASWRSLHGRRWTTFGTPPWFAGAADYDDTVARLTGIGATSDAGTVNWNIRLSATHPTVEIRVCDAQLDAESTIGLVAVIRALADVATDDGAELPLIDDAALWHAARHGMTARLVDPMTGMLVPARHVVQRLCHLLAPALEANGDTDLADRFITRVLREGTGATRQARALRHGIPSLAELYRTGVSGRVGTPTAA